MRFKKIYPVLKNTYSIILLLLFAFQCNAGGLLDTTSVEWNREVDKCVAILNETIARNKNIEDSIIADRHFNFNQVHAPLDINESTKVTEEVTSYMYVSDRNNFNFISDASKQKLDGRLRALQFNAGIAFHVMFHPSDYKMTEAEAAYFNSKVYGRSNLGSSSFNKAILILVSVNQIKSVNNYFGYQPVVSTNCVISISTGAGINPEVKNEFNNIINSVFRNTYTESEREQKYNNVFDAVYRKINFSRKVYAYEVDENGNISEELITLPPKMGNNEAATFTLHVRKPFYISGYASDTKYYKQISPLREEYIKMYSRDFVKLITSSNFPGTYANQYLYQPPGKAYKDEYQYNWSWATAIDAAGLVASCVGLDVFTDFVGAVYYAAQGEWVDAGSYAAGMFVPFVSGTTLKIFRYVGTKTIQFGTNNILKRLNVDLYILGRANGGDYLGTVQFQIDAARQGIDVKILTTGMPVTTPAYSNLSVLEQNTKYWNEINKPFIDKAISDKADIRFIHDPRLPENQYNFISETAQDEFSKKARLEGVTKLETFVKQEYDYLVSKGYKLTEDGLMIKK